MALRSDLKQTSSVHIDSEVSNVTPADEVTGEGGLRFFVDLHDRVHPRLVIVHVDMPRCHPAHLYACWIGTGDQLCAELQGFHRRQVEFRFRFRLLYSGLSTWLRQ